MRTAAWSLCLFSSLVVQLACGDTGDAETTTTTMGPTTLSTVPTADSDASTVSPTDGSATDTSNGTPATESNTEPTTNEPTTATTSIVDPTTGETTNNPVTSLDTSSTSGSESGGPPCKEIMATLQPIPPNIMFVLDKSGSMVAMPNGYWDGDADPNTPDITRWNSLYQVVQDIANANDSKINFGANLFPSKAAQSVYNAGACPVLSDPEVPVAANNAANILAAIPSAMDITIKGGTPSAAGVATALTHLKSINDGAPKAIFLVTDGAANCFSMAMTEMQRFESYDDSLHTIVNDAFMVDGIPTYVIGIDIDNMVTSNMQDGNPNGINPFEKLNELATLGGKPKGDPNEKFYNAVNQLELQAALDVIVSDALSCVIPLESEPGFPDETEVKIGGIKVPKVMDCAVENGWVYTNPDGPYDAIELCGTACTDLKQSGQADVNFFCEAN